MGKPISAVGGVSSPMPPQKTDVGGVSEPSQSPSQSSPPSKSEPVRFWPPAYGWRLSALEGERASHNGWQSRWLEHGSAVAGGGPVDSVAALKPALDPSLVRPNGRPHRA